MSCSIFPLIDLPFSHKFSMWKISSTNVVRQYNALHLLSYKNREIVFNRRHEKNPCSLCAKLRRGALNDIAVQRGCNKVALGHHRDDALETFLLSMFYEGRLHTFQPVTRLDRTGLTVIRPLLYISEKEIIGAARKLSLPIVQSTCPASGETKRQEMKEMLNAICRQIPTARQYMLNALKNTAQYGLWDKCGRDD